jgi:hypothetical protein
MSTTAGLFKTSTGLTLYQGSMLSLVSLANSQTYHFQISYRGDFAAAQFDALSGNDIVLRMVVVPEPTSVSLMLMSLAGERLRRRQFPRGE